MTEITDEGRKLAAELANAEYKKRGSEEVWTVEDDFDGSDALCEAFARLATDHLALKARNAETEAKHEKAVADLREIDRLLSERSCSACDTARAIAAKYRETDPLVEALGAISTAIHAEGFAEHLRAELSKRGFELARVKP